MLQAATVARNAGLQGCAATQHVGCTAQQHMGCSHHQHQCCDADGVLHPAMDAFGELLRLQTLCTLECNHQQPDYCQCADRAGIVDPAIDAFIELLRLQTLDAAGLHQVQLDVHAIRQTLFRCALAAWSQHQTVHVAMLLRSWGKAACVTDTT